MLTTAFWSMERVEQGRNVGEIGCIREKSRER